MALHSDDYIYDEVRIDQIKPGDEIHSLNEATGRLVDSRVNALMDMGVKDIYKLTTASGKTIRTTGVRPYLVKGPVKETDRAATAQQRAAEASGQKAVAPEELSEEREFAGIKKLWRVSFPEEREENADDRSNLADPEGKHPSDEAGFGLRHFDLQPAFGLGDPLLETLFGNGQNSALCPVLDFIENIDKSASSFIGQTLLQDLWDSDNSHKNISLVATLKGYQTSDALSSQAPRDHGNKPPDLIYSQNMLDVSKTVNKEFATAQWLKGITLQPGDCIAMASDARRPEPQRHPERTCHPERSEGSQRSMPNISVLFNTAEQNA